MTESLGKCKVCGEEAGVLYPLLPGEPAFCSAHHNPKDAGPFGCDFSGPDDFGIPDVGWGEYAPKFSRRTFLWTDKERNKHKLEDVDDIYLANIINFLKRRIREIPEVDYDPGDANIKSNEQAINYWEAVVEFLEEEQECRRGVKVADGNI